jgi:hypothetical protein
MKEETSARPAKSDLDTSRCRVTNIGIDTYAECLCSGPNECPYALPFGYGFLCQHPDFNKFLPKETRSVSRGSS